MKEANEKSDHPTKPSVANVDKSLSLDAMGKFYLYSVFGVLKLHYEGVTVLHKFLEKLTKLSWEQQ